MATTRPLPIDVPAPLNPPARVLMGPGPSDVHPRVLASLGMPLLGHLDASFVALMDETQDLLRYVFQTQNRMTLAISGTGSAGMETVVVNLIEPGTVFLETQNRLADTVLAHASLPSILGGENIGSVQ